MIRVAGRGGSSSRTQLIKKMNALMPELDLDALWLLWLRTTDVKRQGVFPSVNDRGSRKRSRGNRKCSKRRVE